MASESLSDERLDMRVRTAYEAITPPDGARERVLESLRLAESEGESQTSTVPRRPSRRVWWIALPVAACVLVALIVVSLGAPTSFGAKSQQAATITDQKQTFDESYEVNAADAVADDEEMMASEAYQSEAYQDAPYKRVTTAEGITYTVGDAVADEPTYSKLEDATALNPTTSESVACVVADGQFVRFEGDSVWYRLMTYSEE